MKLIQRNANQDYDKQLMDVQKNLEIIVKEMDALMRRITDLEANQLPDGTILISG